MNEMLKIGSKFNAYSIALMQTIFISWEWLFLIFFSYSVSALPNGGILAATAFLSNAITRAIFARFFAKFVQLYNEVTRVRISILLRLIFLFFIFALPIIGKNPYLELVWLFIVNLILIFESYSSFHLRYYYEDLGHISFVRQSAISNLGQRGGIIITSIIAFLLGKNDWSMFADICKIIVLAGVVSSCLALQYTKKNQLVIIKKDRNDSKKQEFLQKTVLLGAAVLFTMNLFFGSGMLLLTRASMSHHMTILYGINLVTIFYMGFVLINVSGLFFDKAIMKKSKWQMLFLCYLTTGIISAALYSLQDRVTLCFLLVFIWGALYGLGTIIFYYLISFKIKGKNQAYFYSKIDSVSRSGFVISQVSTGIFLDWPIDSLKLAQIYGIAFLAIMVLIFYVIYKKLYKQGYLSYETATI